MNSVTRQTLLSGLICTLLIVFCYFAIDKPFAFWTAQQDWRGWPFFDGLTHIIDAIIWLCVLYYGYLALAWQNGRPHAWLSVVNSVVIASFLKTALKTVFGRYWPATWINHNPSLLHDNAYGFNWFHAGSWYQSFPSGHAAVALAAATAGWIAQPRLRWFAVIVALLPVIGILACNYHFVSDVLAGAWLGVTVARYVTSSLIKDQE